ncbi:MAG: hypothetical protein ACE5R6_05195 [Candidatus Heimdallarchaeota archaeon]
MRGGIFITVQSLLWSFGTGMMGGKGMMGLTKSSRWAYEHMVEEIGGEAV